MSIKIKKAFRFSVYAFLLLVTSLLGAILSLGKRSNNEISSGPLLPSSSIAHADVVGGSNPPVDAESGACSACGGAGSDSGCGAGGGS